MWADLKETVFEKTFYVEQRPTFKTHTKTCLNDRKSETYLYKRKIVKSTT